MLAICFGLKCYDKIVDGFYLYRIKGPSILHTRTPSFDKDILLVNKALDQPFNYLASGSQSFVFISADKKFILKFFKHYRWKTPFYISWIPFLKESWTKRRVDGLKATYQSCLFCIEEFKQETALIYMQLNPSDTIQKTIKLHNRLGKSYSISLNEMSFVLQKYAEPTSEHLLKLKALKEDATAKLHIRALFTNILQKRTKGFTDKDPNFLNNFGFVNGEAVSVDVGGLIKDPKKDNSYFCNHELKKVARTLLPWLQKHYPELLPYTTTLINEIKEEISKKGDSDRKNPSYFVKSPK